MGSSRRVAMVTFESLSRSTAAGNHIEAVRRALSVDTPTVVCGSESRCPPLRYIAVFAQWCMRSRRGDLLYVRNHPISLAVVVLGALRRQRIVLEVNGPPDDILGAHPRFRPLVQVLQRALRWSVALAEHVIVPTPGMSDYVRDAAPQRPRWVIPAGFDDGTFRQSAEALGEPPYVVFAGANTRWQGVDVLLEAAAHPAWPRDVRVVLIGAFDDLDTTALDTIADRLTRPGVLPPAEVAAYLQRAVAALSPKTYQHGGGPSTGQAPLKVYEALGCGVPCIVTDVPIQNELIRKHDCGTVVPVGDAEAIAVAVATYVGDHKLRQRHAVNAASAAEGYSWTYLADLTRRAVLADRS